MTGSSLFRPSVCVALGTVSLLLAACIASQHRPAPVAPRSGGAAAASGPLAAGGVECGQPITGLQRVRESIIFVGEIHGTGEFPPEFARIVCQIASDDSPGRVLVALELPVRMQPAIDAFMKSGGEPERTAVMQDAFWHREYQDGRSSAAMARLIERLRDLKAVRPEIEIRTLEGEETTQDEREARLARNLADAITELHPARTLIYMGNVHARTLHGYPWNPADPFRSVATRIRESLGDAAAIDLRATGGSAWICTSASALECGARPLPERAQPGDVGRLEPVAPENAPSGFQWTLNVGRVTASPPARGGPS